MITFTEKEIRAINRKVEETRDSENIELDTTIFIDINTKLAGRKSVEIRWPISTYDDLDGQYITKIFIFNKDKKLIDVT